MKPCEGGGGRGEKGGGRKEEEKKEKQKLLDYHSRIKRNMQKKHKKGIKTQPMARCWWLMPVILATWRQRSGRLQFKARPGKNQDPISKISNTNKGWGCGQSSRAPA
jgi:hypothetical protein